MDTSFLVLIAAWLHEPSRHQLPSSYIADEFKYNLGNVKFSSMSVSGRLLSRLRETFVFSTGGRPMDRIAFACLLACEISHFACLIQATPPPPLPLVSIGSGKYSRDWVQCDGAVGGGHSHGCHSYLLPLA